MPAPALALLQRVCLFRLGVGAATLVSIFTGEGKEEVAGPELARLNVTGLETKLALLSEMKLLERDEEGRYNVHPAVRDGFLKNLDEETWRRGHNAARQGLKVSLGDQAESYPSDPATLDLLEEIVYHTAAGHVGEAWDVYRNRIGGYGNLGWRLGAYERGERICRALAGGRPPEEAPPVGRQRALLAEWALYLDGLGRLDAAARCLECTIEEDVQIHQYESSSDRYLLQNASRSNQGLTNVLVLAGRLATASEAAEEALRWAERADEFWELSTSYGYRAHVRALRGATSGALVDFRDALHWQLQCFKDSEPLFSNVGVWHTLLLARLGQNEEATRLTEANKESLRGGLGEQNQDFPKCNLILADLARKRHDHDTARRLLDVAHEWAIARDAKEPLCWAALVRARLEQSPSDARRAIEDGLRIARDCGYGIYHVDLLLNRASLALEEGDADAALADINTALFDGVRPPEESGLPELLAATAPECGYAWGEAEGHHLRAEALLLRAAQRLGRGDFAPARFGELPEDVRGLVDEARQELETCRRLREKIQDYKVAETEDVLAQLDGGVLTRRPLKPAAHETAAPSSKKKASSKKVRAAKKKHVFLSYVRENSADVEILRDDLIRNGETVWWDRDIPPGANWKQEIRKALKNAFAFVLCLSETMAERVSSGAFPEVRDAIGMYREKAPGGIFIIPVRLSDCEVPSFEIDATTTLEDLQFVDLFPEAQRPNGVRRLVKALREIPSHNH